MEWTDYVSEALNMHVFAVPSKDFDSTVVPVLPSDHKKIVVGSVTLISILGRDNRDSIRKMLQKLLDESVPHNYAYFDKKSDAPDVGHVIRYDHQGGLENTNSRYADPTITEVVTNLIRQTNVIGFHEALLLAHCYAMNSSWENQEEYSKMHKMLKLIGGL